jgi:hypothetical protein
MLGSEIEPAFSASPCGLSRESIAMLRLGRGESSVILLGNQSINQCCVLMGGVKSSDGKQNGRGKREEARLRGSHQKTPTGRVDPVGGFDEFRSHSIHAPYQIPGTAWPVTNCAENRPCSRLANIVQARCAVLRSVCGNRQDRKACFWLMSVGALKSKTG